MLSVLVLGAKVPFTSGGQEVLVKQLCKALKERGVLVDTAEIPFSPFPKEALLTQSAIWRSLNLKATRVIATKFPTYYVKFPKKSVWLVHQHRPCFDLYGTRFSDFSDDPRDEVIRRNLTEGDEKVLKEADPLYGISKNVVSRLKTFHGISADPLYPPLPLGDKYYSDSPEPYILCVGRICSIKRVDLIIKSMPLIHEFVTLKIVGTPDEPGIMEYLQNEIKKHHLSHRVTFCGRVSDGELLTLYSKCMFVYYAPYNEDYGFVTLEAFSSGKPVLTATDSGGILEFVTDMETGVVAEPTEQGIADGANMLISNEVLRASLGKRGKEVISELNIPTWDIVCKKLVPEL